jgi:ribosomal protein L11 methyltransferase
MAWLQLRVTTRHPEFADEILQAHGASAVSFVDAVDKPVLEPAPGETPLWEDTITLGLFTEGTDLAPVLDGLRELLPDGAEAQFQTELIEDQDWVRVWLKDCPPLKFGERFWVVPREKVNEVTQKDAVLLRLDPGLAFGTGTHPTTALCLEWLAGQDLEGKTVLDYGCGSGVLAIAALLLGAERAFCVDIDPQALIATHDNAQENGVADRITAMLPDAFVPFAADVVLANILANPLIQLAPLLARCVKRDGRLVLAGLLDRQAAEVHAAYAPWFDADPDATREGWTRISARCRQPNGA